MRQQPRTDREVNAFFQSNGIGLQLVTRKADQVRRWFRVSEAERTARKVGVSLSEERANRILEPLGLDVTQVLYADALELKQAN